MSEFTFLDGVLFGIGLLIAIETIAKMVWL